jgi:hypothetical protein
MKQQFIPCPQCGFEIPLDEALSGSIEEELRKEYDTRIRKQQQELEKQKKALESKEKEIERAEKAVDEKVEKKLAERLKDLEKEAKKKAEKELRARMKSLEEEIEEQAKELGKMQEAELRLRKEQRDLEKAKKAFELEMARQLDKERKAMEEELRESLTEEFNLKSQEAQIERESMARQINELKQKLEQGSMQVQGESLERQLEEDLASLFAQDRIEPVAVGKRGADVVQVVCDGMGRECGTILWEAKRAKSWSDDWMDKLREDKRDAGAELAVIVSTALPKGEKAMSYQNGIWICDYRSCLGLATALRVQLIEMANMRQAALGKDEKMEMLYAYLSGQEFRHRVETLVEGFTAMQEDLTKEKAAVNRLWKKREKQITKVITCTAGMYGDMQGIIGASMPEIESLELRAITGGFIDDEGEDGEILD